MAKLSLVINEKQRYFDDSDKYCVNVVDVYNSETKQNVSKSDPLTFESGFENDILVNSGITLFNVNGDTRLIIEYKDACWPDNIKEKLESLYQEDNYPYKEINGKIQNVIPLELILKYSNEITFYSAKGKRITGQTRGEIHNYRVRDFDIKLDKDKFTMVVADALYSSTEIYKVVYDYNKEKLDVKQKEISNKDLIKQTFNEIEKTK